MLSFPPDIRHPEELSLLRKPRDPKKKKKKLEEAEEDDLELEGPLLTPGSGEQWLLHGLIIFVERFNQGVEILQAQVCSF